MADNLFSLIFGKKRRVRIGGDATTYEFLPTGGVEFDAVLSESHGGTNEITKHPVETGADITDHIRRQPETLALTGVISNTPLVFLASLTEKPDRAERGYQALKKIKDDGTLVRVLTTLREYDNMVIQSMTVNRDVQTGNIVKADLQLVEIFTAESIDATTNPVDTSPQSESPTTLGDKPAILAGAAVTLIAASSIANALG